MTTLLERRGRPRGVKVSISLIHSRPGATRPTGRADWSAGFQTLTSNQEENTRTLLTSGCHSGGEPSSTREGGGPAATRKVAVLSWFSQMRPELHPERALLYLTSFYNSVLLNAF